MALVSPGVQVTVVDESTYFPSVAGTVPYILIATAANKNSSVSTTIAAGTLPENANKVYLITSQFDLLNTYGAPIFTTNGAETNEYGLLAAYAALGVSNRCYVQRVDVDLSTIVGSLQRPSANPTDGSYYLDVDASQWGFNVWNVATNTFTYQNATVITDSTLISNGSDGAPIAGFGKGGDIVINGLDPNLTAYQKMVATATGATERANVTLINGQYQVIGSTGWQSMIPTVVSPLAGPSSYGQNVTVTYTTPGTGTGNTISSLLSSMNGNTQNGATMGYLASSNTANTYMALYQPVDNPTVGFGGVGFIIREADSGNTVADSYGFGGQNSFNYYNCPVYQAGENYTYPSWNSLSTAQHSNSNIAFGGFNSPSGSIWQNASPDTNGSLVILQKWSASLGQFITEEAKFYYNDVQANFTLDPAGGGYNIPIGTKYVAYDLYDLVSGCSYPPNAAIGQTARQDIYRNPTRQPNRNPKHTIYNRYANGATVVTGNISNPIFPTGSSFTVAASEPGSSALVYGPGSVTIANNANAQDFINTFSQGAPANVSASLNSAGQIVITHTQGGTVFLFGDPTTLFAAAGFVNTIQGIQSFPAIVPGLGALGQSAYLTFSNWTPLSYGFYSNGQVALSAPPNGTQWYWNNPTTVDIMIQNNGAWVGYQNCTNSVRGENLSLTDPTGVIFSTSQPLTQTTGNSLVAGDLWIDTSDLENYPQLYRWTLQTGGGAIWVKVDTTSPYTTAGVLFADARWAPNGTTNPATDAIPTTISLLTSNYLDLDAPNPLLYPQGVLLFNTRRSGYNVKQYVTNYFNQAAFPGQSLPTQTATWLSISGNKPTGGAYMGRQAQRGVVIQALKAGVDNSLEVREEQKDINLLSCPQYPELAINLVALNNERDSTGFVIVDTPLRLAPQDIVTWRTNNNGLGLPTADGLTIGDPYAGAWYPSCLTTDLSGNQVVTCPSHMILRTILQSDRDSYPWIASAGTQRGLVDDALQIGYLDAQSNNFVPLQVNQGTRDVLYTNSINPITVVPGSGIVNFGNKTVTGLTTALDRVNVARLVAFLRRRLGEVADQFLFEPNDEITRNSVKNAIDSLMIDLVAKRALYDYLVVCDLSNNTPFRIDNNELWVDIAIEPVKSVEFIYIPIRIKNTGAIGSSAVA